MATAVAMDIDQSKGKSSSALAINKSSAGKISKSSSLRKNNPIVQQAKPMPTSKVYNTDATSFRNLVQQLTGCDAPPSDPAPSVAPPPPRPPATGVSEVPALAPSSYHPSLSAFQPQPVHQSHHHLQQVQQVPLQPQMVLPDPGAPPRHMHVDLPLPGSPSSGSSGVSSPHQSSSRPVNTRLQRMAPPPLRPTFSFLAHKLAAQQQNSQLQPQAGGGSGGGTSEHINSPGAHPLSPISKRVSPMPLLSFSPLPVLSPSDNAWANFESPNTAAMKQLAQSIIDGKGAGAGRFPWSPLGLASPGLPVPELFPDVKMIETGSSDVKNTGNTTTTTTTATTTTTTNNNNNNKNNSNNSNEFSFPEL